MVGVGRREHAGEGELGGGGLDGEEGVGAEVVGGGPGGEAGAGAVGDTAADLGDIIVGGRGQLVKSPGAVLGAGEEAVGDDGVEVHVEVHEAAEALHEDDGAGLAAEAAAAALAAEMGEDDAEEDTEDGGHRRRVTGQDQAEVEGQGHWR